MMAGSLSGELLGLSCVCLSGVSCTLIAATWRGSGVPCQPTSEPCIFPEPSQLGLPGTLEQEPYLIACRCGSEQAWQARPLG